MDVFMKHGKDFVVHNNNNDDIKIVITLHMFILYGDRVQSSIALSAVTNKLRACVVFYKIEIHISKVCTESSSYHNTY